MGQRWEGWQVDRWPSFGSPALIFYNSPRIRLMTVSNLTGAYKVFLLFKTAVQIKMFHERMQFYLCIQMLLKIRSKFQIFQFVECAIHA